MKFIKSPITLCTILGLVLGYFGIPVHPPAYGMWVWNRPYQFHIASILIFGTLGCLVGLFFYLWIWKHLNREASLWLSGIFSIALVFGIIGVFRYQAYNETVMWTDVNLGFVRIMGVSRDNVANTHATDAGVQMIQAGADIQAGLNMGGMYPNLFGQQTEQKLSSIASALSEAGYYMVSQKDKEKLHESTQFVNQAGAIVRQIGNQSYPNKTNNLEEVTSKIYGLIPSDMNNGWPAN